MDRPGAAYVQHDKAVETIVNVPLLLLLVSILAVVLIIGVLLAIVSAFFLLLIIFSDSGQSPVTRIAGLAMLIGFVVGFFSYTGERRGRNAAIAIALAVVALLLGLLTEPLSTSSVLFFPVVSHVLLIVSIASMWYLDKRLFPLPSVEEQIYRCPSCGYDTRHLPEPRCPECGMALVE